MVVPVPSWARRLFELEVEKQVVAERLGKLQKSSVEWARNAYNLVHTQISYVFKLYNGGIALKPEQLKICADEFLDTSVKLSHFWILLKGSTTVEMEADYGAISEEVSDALATISQRLKGD